MLNAIGRDALAALRGMRKQPGLLATVVLSLALGIGASTAMFTVVRGVLLAPLPYAAPHEIVSIFKRWTGFEKTWLSEREVLDYRARTSTLQSVAAWDSTRVTLTGAGEAARVGAAFVTPNTFDVFGVRPFLGRTFTDEESLADTRDRPALVVLGYGLWQRQFGGDRAALDRALEVNGRPARVIGVMPRGFRLPTDYTDDAAEPTELWMPLGIDPAQAQRGNHGLFGAGRLRPGATPAQATADLASITAALTAEGQYSPQSHFTAFAVGVEEEVLGSVEPALLMLMGAVGFLMLIACANAAALLLARAETRQREFATRTALGASRWRLARQQLVEGGLVAAAGGVLGLGLAFAAKRFLEALGPTAIPRALDVAVDWRTAAFLVGASGLAAVLCSVPPALRAFRVGLVDTLKDGSAQSSTGRGRHRLRSGLVVAQLAFSVLLLIGAGLMLKSLWALQRIDLGFDAAGVLTARIAIAERPYDTQERIDLFFDRVLSKTRALPGVEHAGIIRSLPIGSVIGDSGMRVEGYMPPPGQNAKGDWQVATTGALEALGERLIRGRLFTAADTSTSPPVVLVNETLAATYWPNQDPIGRRVKFGGDQMPWATIVGVVGNVRHNGIEAPVKGKFYRLYSQFNQLRNGTMVVRTTGDPAALAGPLRAVVREVDPSVPLAAVRTMDEVIDTALTSPRLTGSVLVAFGGVAIVLSALGLYGLLVYLVSERTREIGIRVAIGAQRGQIIARVLGQGVRLATIGAGLGLLLAFAWTRTLQGLLHGVTAVDPATFIGVPLVLVGVAIVASFIPARRAASVDPIRALK
jgi:putative ABC transport system permease protein